VLLPFFFLGLWELSARALSGFALASPSQTFTALVRGVENGWIVTDTKQTLTELAVAYGFAVAIGVAAGFVIGMSDFFEDVLGPLVHGVYSLPKLTLYPVFLVLFSIGFDSIVAFGWFHGVFPITIITMQTINDVDDVYWKVAEGLGLSRWNTFREVALPAVLPGLVVGLRLGFSTTFLGIVVAEMFASKAGLGRILVESIGQLAMDRQLAVITVLIIIAIVGTGIFVFLESLLHGSSRSGGTIR
jgi:NitT/TauT family transport system permease protein